MLNNRCFRQIMPLIVVSLLIFSSCEDKTGNLGLDVLPSDDLFSGTDATSYLNAKNTLPEQVRTGDAEYAILGTVNDPVAGQTNASFITQINIGDYPDVFNQNEDYSVDSLVLNLAYAKQWWFGDKHARHNVQVYRINESLSLSGDYHTNMNIEGLYDPEPIGERISSGWDAQPDSVWEDEDYVHQWQFKLDDELANEFFNYSEDILASKESFQEAFAGLLVKSELIDTDTPGSLVTFDLMASESSMNLYYSYHERDSATNEIDTTKHTSHNFPINIECVRINKFEHNYEDEVVFNNFNADRLVIQGMAGSLVEIDFNEVEFNYSDNQSMKLFEFWEEKMDDSSDDDDYYGISGVDIFFKADTSLQFSDDSFYSPVPQSLRIFEKDDNGNFIEPTYETGSDSDPLNRWFTGGSYNEETGEYRFRISGDYFRMMVEDPELRGPYFLGSPETDSFSWRVAFLNNQSEESLTPELRIKYINIDTP